MFNTGCNARAVGGREAEKEERQKWINRERKRIEDSVNGNGCSYIKFICESFILHFNYGYVNAFSVSILFHYGSGQNSGFCSVKNLKTCMPTSFCEGLLVLPHAEQRSATV